MNLGKSTGLSWLMVANLSATLLLMISSANGFDLNKEPDQEGELYEPFSTSISKAQNPITEVKTPPNRRKVAKGRKKQVSPAFYDKVMKLLDVLKICNKEDFDINSVVIPDSFSAENRAMMALNEVSKNILIKKKDEERFKRTMKNCLLVLKVIQKRTESNMSIDSEMSGGTYEDRIARLKESPLDNLKDRFLKPNEAKTTSSPVATNINQSEANTRKPPPSITVVNSAVEISQRKQDKAKPRLIKFL